MNRDGAYLRMLDASAKMQWNVAMILEAKAVEAEKACCWFVNHVSPDAFADHHGQLKETTQAHGHVIEALEGLTKLGQGLTRVLKAALGQDGEGGEGGGGPVGGGFDLGDR